MYIVFTIFIFKMKVLKCKYTYYVDNVHMYGFKLCDRYFVKSFLKEGENFVITVDDTELKLHFTNNDLTYFKDEYGAGTFDIDELDVSDEWINSCYGLWLERKQLMTKSNELLGSKPNVLSKYDIFAKTFEEGILSYKQQDYQQARLIFEKLYNDSKFHEEIHICSYNVACCYSADCDIDNAIKWLETSMIDGYVNWSNVILDNDFKNIRNDKKFVEIIKQMIEKNPKIDFGSREVVSYLEIHNLKALYDQKSRNHYKGPQ